MFKDVGTGRHEFGNRVAVVVAGDRAGGLLGPDVFADREAQAQAVAEDGLGAGVAGLEVPHLVKDIVRGQKRLVLFRQDAAVGDQGGGVVERQAPRTDGAVHETHEQCRAADLAHEVLQGRKVVGHETLLQQEVLRRVAQERELGRDDHVGAQRLGAAVGIEDAAQVALDVADGRV
jgi:hypothetical protein